MRESSKKMEIIQVHIKVHGTSIVSFKSQNDEAGGHWSVLEELVRRVSEELEIRPVQLVEEADLPRVQLGHVLLRRAVQAAGGGGNECTGFPHHYFQSEQSLMPDLKGQIFFFD